MSNIPTIKSANLSISGLFEDFYIVPDFQREYVWKSENVKKLLEDIFEGLGLYSSDDSPSEYFLGSIVVYPDLTNDEKTFQLIDGQQRLTTVYLIFCAIRDSIKRLDDQSKSVEKILTGVAQDLKTGEDIDKHRLSLQYDSTGKKWIQHIVEGKSLEKVPLTISQSAQNLSDAWKTIQDFFREYVEDDSKEFKRISSAISKRTKIIRIESPTLRNALKVFETINDRGVGLTPVDLLKNYLFIHTKDEQNKNLDWKTLTQKWEKLLNILYKSNQKPLQFLRYYLLSHYSVDLSNNFPEDEIYDWFIKKGKEYGIQDRPLYFLDQLIEAADNYCKFTQSKNTNGSENSYLKNISKIQGRARQHLILLMGGRQLNVGLFNELSNHVENLFFINAITRKTRRKDINITREFSQSSRKLRLVKTKSDLDDFVIEYILPEMQSLKEDFREALLQTSGVNLAKYRVRYLLAKISQYIENKSFKTKKPLEIYLHKSITLEHILPKSSGDPYCEKLGNLTLLEKTINSSIKDETYKQKLLGYKQSQILLTRSLESIPNVGKSTTLNCTMSDLKLSNYESWNHDSIDQRQKVLVDIAMKVWGMDW